MKVAFIMMRQHPRQCQKFSVVVLNYSNLSGMLDCPIKTKCLHTCHPFDHSSSHSPTLRNHWFLSPLPGSFLSCLESGFAWEGELVARAPGMASCPPRSPSIWPFTPRTSCFCTPRKIKLLPGIYWKFIWWIRKLISKHSFMTMENVEGDICVAYQNLVIASILNSLSTGELPHVCSPVLIFHYYKTTSQRSLNVSYSQSVNRKHEFRCAQLDGRNGRRPVNKTNTFQLFDITGWWERDFFFKAI